MEYPSSFAPKLFVVKLTSFAESTELCGMNQIETLIQHLHSY